MGNEASAPSPHGSGGGARGVEPEADKMRNIQRMDASLRKKLRGGVHYNMKVVLKGERGSGKSALLRRLQGLPFIQEYTPTPQIQTGTINWSFKNSEDTVKVEVWDVVDKGIRVKPGETPRLPPEDAAGMNAEEEDAPAGLPFEYTVPSSSSSSSGSSAFGVLDAGMVDVYQQCQCAMFVIRPDSTTALDYLRKELPQVPPSIPVLLLLNFRDTPGHVITMAELRSQIMAGQACEGRTRVHAFESSMLNCYGLRTLYAYLGVPFLLMKAETIRRQLSQAEQDLTASEAELAGMVEDDGYDKYVEGMQTRRAKPPPPPPPATSSPSPARAPPPASPARVPTEQAATSSPAPPAVVMLQHARPPPPLPEPVREDSGGGGEKKKGSNKGSPDKKQRKERRQKHHKGGNTVMAAAGAAAMGEPEAAPNLTDVMEFSVDTGNKELDDFFGHDDEEEGEEEEEERRRREEYARISACLKPEARQEGGKKASRGSRASSSSSTAGMFMEAGDDDEEEDEGAFVYVGLKPVNLNIPSRLEDIPSSAAPTGIREEAGENAAAAQPPLQPVMRMGSSGSALDDMEVPPGSSDISSPAVSVGEVGRTGEVAAEEVTAAVASKAEEEGGGKGPTVVVEETGTVVEEGQGESAAAGDATSASSTPPPPATAAAAAAVEEDDAAGEGEKREEEEPARVAEEDTAAVAAPPAVKEEEGPEEEGEGEEGIDAFVPSTVDLNFGDDEEEEDDKVLSGISPARLHNKLAPPAGMVVDDDDDEDDGLTALEKLGSGRQVDLDDSDVENEGPASRPLTISPATVIKPVPQALPMGIGIDATPAQSAAGLSEAARAAIAATMASLGQEVGALDGGGDGKKKKRSKEKEGRKKEKKPSSSSSSSSRSRKKSTEAVGGGEDDL